MKTHENEYRLPVPMEFYFEFYNNNFWISFIHQSIFLITESLWISGFDILCISFIISLHQHITLFSMRINNIPDMINDALNENPGKSRLSIEKKILSKIIQHHQKIYE